MDAALGPLRRRLPAARLTGGAGGDGEDFDPFGEFVGFRRGVVPGEVEVVAAAVPDVAFVADPAERGDRLFLFRLRPEGEGGDRHPVRVAGGGVHGRHEVDREAVQVVGGGGVAFVAADVLAVGERAGVAVGDEDRVAGGEPAQVSDDPAVDHVARFVGDGGGDLDQGAGGVDDPQRAGGRR